MRQMSADELVEAALLSVRAEVSDHVRRNAHRVRDLQHRLPTHRPTSSISSEGERKVLSARGRMEVGTINPHLQGLSSDVQLRRLASVRSLGMSRTRTIQEQMRDAVEDLHSTASIWETFWEPPVEPGAHPYRMLRDAYRGRAELCLGLASDAAERRLERNANAYRRILDREQMPARDRHLHLPAPAPASAPAGVGGRRRALRVQMMPSLCQDAPGWWLMPPRVEQAASDFDSSHHSLRSTALRQMEACSPRHLRGEQPSRHRRFVEGVTGVARSRFFVPEDAVDVAAPRKAVARLAEVPHLEWSLAT
jgi:hypothetical protein